MGPATLICEPLFECCGSIHTEQRGRIPAPVLLVPGICNKLLDPITSLRHAFQCLPIAPSEALP